MDMSVAGSGNSLNMLHLFYSVGALTAPLAIGLLVALGVDWRAIALATSLGGARPRRSARPRGDRAPASAITGRT